MTGSSPRLVTIMYHYVRDVEATPFPDIKAVSLDEFRRQVAQVKESFETPPVEACLEFLAGTWQPQRDICLLTFDDGLREHHDTVADILAGREVPAAFFLPTAALEDHEVLTVHMNHFLLAALGTTNLSKHLRYAADELNEQLPDAPTTARLRSVYRWDDVDTARLKYLVNHQLPVETTERLLTHIFGKVLGPPEEFARELYVDWDEARAMQDAGFAVGGHTHRHKVLAKLAEPTQRADLERSMSLLRTHLGPGPRAFAYPYGKPVTYTLATIRDLEEIGYSCAFNTTVGDGHPGTSRWEIPRIDPKDL